MRAEKKFSAETGSVRDACQFVSSTLSDMPAAFIEDVVLMVSELATNSVTHARSPFTLRLELDATSLRIEIDDQGGDLPRKRTPRLDEPFGRGLHIVDTLSESWGVELAADGGKTIWIIVPLPAAVAALGAPAVVVPPESRVVFDDLVPNWLFPARPPWARVAIGLLAPAIAGPALVALRDHGNARPGPFLSILLLLVAASAGWPGASLAGIGVVAEYTYYVTPTHSSLLGSPGAMMGVLGLSILALALVGLTARIERTVEQVRALDRERREHARTQSDLRRRAERTASQAEAALALGSVLAVAHTVSAVAEAALNELNIPTAPNFASVAVVDGDHLRVLGARGATPELVRDLETVELRRSPWLGGVLEGEPIYVEDRSDFATQYPSAAVLRMYTSGSWLVVPFRTEETVGLLSLHFAEAQPLRDYRLYFSLVSELLGTSLERARSEERQLRQHRELERAFAERDRIARTLSTSVLPPKLPRIPGFAAAGWLLPASADEVSGDFYDLFAVDDGWVGVLGDVCGKGAEAAAVAALARYAARAAALENPDPSHVARVANQALVAEPSDLFCTAAVVRYVRDAGEVEVTLAGHLQARLVNDGEVVRLGRFGAALGLATDAPVVDRYSLAPGSVVVLFSDGLVERDPAFGEDELDGFLAQQKGRSAVELSTDLRSLVARLTPKHRDDVAVLVLERVQ